MATAEHTDLRSYALQTAERAQAASRCLATVSGEVKNRWLKRAAELLRARRDELAAANAQDLAAASRYGLSPAQVDRLRLTPEVIESMAAGLEAVAALPEPIGEVIESQRTAQRLGSAQGARAAGRGFFHLRIASERHGRCCGDLRQERQRGDPARRQRGHPFQSARLPTCWPKRPLKWVCRRTPCRWCRPPTVRRWDISSRSTSSSMWPFHAAARG